MQCLICVFVLLTDQLQKAENTTKEVKEQILELRGTNIMSSNINIYKNIAIYLYWSSVTIKPNVN